MRRGRCRRRRVQREEGWCEESSGSLLCWAATKKRIGSADRVRHYLGELGLPSACSAALTSRPLSDHDMPLDRRLAVRMCEKDGWWLLEMAMRLGYGGVGEPCSNPS